MAKRSAFTDFDEFFMNAFQFQQSLNEKRETRMQDINFKLRQLSLISDYRDEIITGQKQQEARLQEAQDFDIRSSFVPIEGRQNIRTGEFDNETNLPARTGEDLNKQFGRNLFDPIGGFVRKDLIPEAPKQEGIERTITDYSSGEGIIYGITDSGERKRLGKAKPITEKTTDKDPKPEKWKNFGKSVGELKKFEKGSDDYKNARTSARQSAYATMLPNAWGFYKKHFIDGGSEKVSNRHFLSRVRWGLEKNLINAEDAQDLIDFGKYRSDLFEINK